MNLKCNVIFVQILRVARAALQSHKDGSCLDDDFYHDFLSILDESLLPGTIRLKFIENK